MKKEKPTTKICKHCKTEIPFDAKVCPQCRKKQGTGCLTKILIFIGIIIVLSFFVGEDEESSDTSEKATTEATVEEKTTTEADVPTEYKSALKKAQIYSDKMHMSKDGIYDQLTSEYGEQFDEKAATYAIKHVDANWKENALAKAKEYQQEMSMSKEAIRDQLTSEYGEQFTQEQADYAVEHLE